ncbi:HAD family hydrolase [Chlorobium sp. KB01]|uniref:KdsC family phosphatase n=1 Tax=Chlorobium sp. KB01 TaxID=1917528 RepID=UPI0018EA25F4|nr:HAD hydrolase family protein [Chlorobium sp. KB01]
MNTQELLASVQLVIFDFDGVFTDNTVYLTQDGIESVRCWRSDGLGLALLRGAGVKSVIISTETNPVVSRRAEKLKMPYKQGVEDKAAAVLESCKEFDILPEYTMFVGNDINDIPAFRVVGIPVAVADAYPETVPHVLFRTKNQVGSERCVRFVIWSSMRRKS